MKPSPLITNRRYDLLWIFILIILLLLIIFAWPAPASGAFPALPAQAATPTAQPSPTPTAIPSEYLETAEQTNGIVFGSVVLILVIVGGTLWVLRRKNGNGANMAKF